MPHDQSQTASFLPAVNGRAHCLFKSPNDRKQRVLTIAKQVTTKPESMDSGAPAVADSMTRRAALQILLGNTDPRASKHAKIDASSKRQKHERTKDEISKLRTERNSALRNIDTQIDQSFAKDSVLGEDEMN